MPTGLGTWSIGARGDALPRLRLRLLWQGLGWVMIGVVIWLSLTPTPPAPPDVLAWDKADHLLAYAGLMFWFAQAFARRWRWPLLLLLLGLILELLQGLSAFRSFDRFDLLANALGVLLGYGLAGTFLGRTVAALDHWLSRRIG